MRGIAAWRHIIPAQPGPLAAPLGATGDQQHLDLRLSSILVDVWQHGVGATGCNHAARVCQGQGHPLDCVHADAHGPGSYH